MELQDLHQLFVSWRDPSNNHYSKTCYNSGSRFYNSTTTVSSSDISTFTNTAGGEASNNRAGSVTSALSGAGKTITLGTLTLTDGTGLASNYSLASGTFDVNSDR